MFRQKICYARLNIVSRCTLTEENEEEERKTN